MPKPTPRASRRGNFDRMNLQPSTPNPQPFVDDASGIAEVERRRRAAAPRLAEAIIIGALFGATLTIVLLAVLAK